MADGDQTLKMTLRLSPDAVRHLQAAADRQGVSLDAYASEVIEQHLFDYDSYDWQDEDPRQSRGAPVESGEPTYAADDVMKAFRAELERRLATKT